MNPNAIFSRALLAVAIAAAVSVTALARESTYEETRIDVRTQPGAVETVIVGALAPGEARSVTTIAGNPARVTRTDAGLTLAVAGETFDVPMPQAEAFDPSAAAPDGAKIVRIEQRVDHATASAEAGAKRKVIVRRHGDAKDLATDVDLDDPGPLADGQRVRVIRQVRREAVGD